MQSRERNLLPLVASWVVVLIMVRWHTSHLVAHLNSHRATCHTVGLEHPGVSTHVQADLNTIWA